MINIESVFLIIVYMNAFDRTAVHAVIYIVLSIDYIYGSKVGAHYRSTLFTDLNLEIAYC